jgi:hypothetical protein
VPDELKGKELTASLEFQKTAFKIELQTTTFTVKK